MKVAFERNPWIIVGDFNTPLFLSKKKGGVDGFLDSMQDFESFINNNNLMDTELRNLK